MNEVEQKLSELRELWKNDSDPVKKKNIEIEADSLKCRHLLDNGSRCRNPRRSMDSYSCEPCFNRLVKEGPKGKRTIEQARAMLMQWSKEIKMEKQQSFFKEEV